MSNQTPTLYSNMLTRNTYKPVHIITIEKPTPITNQTESADSLNPNAPVYTPLPRVSDPQFKKRWNERHQNNTTTVTFELIPGVKQMEYLDALTTYIDATNIESVGRDDGRQCIVFTNEKAAQEAIIKGLEINGTFVSGIPVCIKPTRVILSQIPSFMPEEKIMDYLKQFGKLVTWLRPIPINSNNIPKYQHILSFRREIFIQLQDGIDLPNKLKINFNGVVHQIYIETEATCYKCKNTGHMTHSCPLGNPSLPIIPPLTPSPSTSNFTVPLIPPIPLNPSISSEQRIQNLKQSLLGITTQNLNAQQQPTQETSSSIFTEEAMDLTGNELEQVLEVESKIAGTSRRIAPLTQENVKRLKTSEIFKDTEEEQESDKASNISDMSINEMHGIFKTTIPLKDLQNIIKNTNYKKNLQVVKTAVEGVTSNYETLVDDLQTYRDFVLQTSPKPQNICQRIDRLLPKIRDIISTNQAK